MYMYLVMLEHLPLFFEVMHNSYDFGHAIQWL